jgi:hypothetical protein
MYRLFENGTGKSRDVKIKELLGNEIELNCRDDGDGAR